MNVQIPYSLDDKNNLFNLYNLRKNRPPDFAFRSFVGIINFNLNCFAEFAVDLFSVICMAVAIQSRLG